MNESRSPIGTNEIGIRNDEFLHQPIYPHRFQSSRWDFCFILFAPGDESPGYCHRCPLTGHQNRFKLALMPIEGEGILKMILIINPPLPWRLPARSRYGEGRGEGEGEGVTEG
jgi:hypothetical protein